MKKIRRIISMVLAFVMLFTSVLAYDQNQSLLDENDPRIIELTQDFDEWDILEDGYQTSSAYAIKDGVKLVFTWDKYSNEITQEVSIVDPSILDISKDTLRNDSFLLETKSSFNITNGTDGDIDYDVSEFLIGIEDLELTRIALPVMYPLATLLSLLGEALFNVLLTAAVVVVVEDALTGEKVHYMDAAHVDTKSLVKKKRSDRCPYFPALIKDKKVLVGPKFKDNDDAYSWLAGQDYRTNNLFTYYKSDALEAANSAGTARKAHGPEKDKFGTLNYYDHYHPYNAMYKDKKSPGHSFYYQP